MCAMTTNNVCPILGRSTPRQSVFFGEHNCPVECVTKLLLFLAVTVIILYIPLGRFTMYCDPTACAKTSITSMNENNAAMCCLCDMYKMMIHVGRAASETAELIVCLSLNVLYEGKLQFYRLLEALDSRDLCRSVCCRDENKNMGQEKRCCRCGKNKPCKTYRSI